MFSDFVYRNNIKNFCGCFEKVSSNREFFILLFIKPIKFGNFIFGLFPLRNSVITNRDDGFDILKEETDDQTSIFILKLKFYKWFLLTR